MGSSLSNPFQTLYLTEALTDPYLYGDLFSPTLLASEAGRLYKQGNVVLIGSNGTGKTMLLRMFAPAVQAAYMHHHGELPLPNGKATFGIGVNLVQDGFNALGNRALTSTSDDRFLWPLIVGDLLNYHLCRQLFRALRYLSGDGAPLAKHLGARVDQSQLDAFASRLAGNECWFGAHDGIVGFDGLEEAFTARIRKYKAFINWNTRDLPPEVNETKTEIGGPLSCCRSALVECDILPATEPLTVTIDQYETLWHTDYKTRFDDPDATGRSLCRVVNTLLTRRDAFVSYKVGVRPYAWTREPRALGTDAHVELCRDYQEVNLDKILTRRENSKTAIFPQFARDVAKRRLTYALRSAPHPPKDIDKFVDKFLAGLLEVLTPEKAIEHYCRDTPSRLLRDHPEWPQKWRTGYASLYQRSKLEAQFAETWITQQLNKGKSLPPVFPESTEASWHSEWWRKERQDALMMRIASDCFQRRLYGGWDDIITLSSYNILVFLSLWREMWDISERSSEGGPLASGQISVDIQSQAIRMVSEDWFAKQTSNPGGSQRQDVIRRLGVGIRKALLEDRSLSYPGHNGFSLALEEYDSANGLAVKAFLEDAADYGAMIATSHTTKERDKKPRRKFYLFPILCPTFEIPAVRTKEPYYATLDEVRGWLSEERPAIVFVRGREARRVLRGRLKRIPNPSGPSQGSLFPRQEKDPPS